MTEQQRKQDSTNEFRLHGGPHLPITIIVGGDDVNPDGGGLFTRHPFASKIKIKPSGKTKITLKMNFEKDIDPDLVQHKTLLFVTNIDNSNAKTIKSSYFDKSFKWEFNITKKEKRSIEATVDFDFSDINVSESRGYTFIFACESPQGQDHDDFQGAVTFQVIK
ncbi:hypothetical protein [Armatimonas rosea]|uniref:Uncharacterized protein n=1 Tax=Armatimonas rosea TaxID=685828 RepID=A0A7W9SU84_ARMRO|nr:hypothetical protein [Armatimonas rosea]MBB6052910.1 hypothetical protein [Armatimonas rosea]